MAEGILATFRQPFPEQIAAWRIRLGNQLPTAAWDDLWQAQHDRAFVVAGALKADLLADLAAAVDKAITQGTTLEEFRRDFRRIVEERGWHGWTGEGTAKGEAWRTRVIYQTNMRTSYAAGRHAQLVAGGYKFWVYRHGGSLEPRIQHLSWDGVALPPDHPFWATHYPPNGWGCSCRAFGARSEAGIKRVGGDPGKSLPDGWDAADPRTGAPVGIDRGWAYAPGASVAEAVNILAPKLDTLPQEIAGPLARDLAASSAFEAWAKSPSEPFPIAVLPAEQAARIGAGTRIVRLSSATLAKQQREHPELMLFEYAKAQEVIDGATEIIADGPLNLIFVFAPNVPGGVVIVVKATRTGGGLFLTSLRRLSRDEAIRDAELARLRRRG